MKNCTYPSVQRKLSTTLLISSGHGIDFISKVLVSVKASDNINVDHALGQVFTIQRQNLINTEDLREI